MHSMKQLTAAMAVALFAACGDGTGPAPTLAVQFRANGGSPPAAQQFVGPRYAVAGASGAFDLAIGGSNGTLDITAITLLLGQLELDGSDDGDCESDPAHCDEIEAGPFVVDVPLTGEPVTIANAEITPGLYRELEFEVEDFDADEGESAVTLEQLLETVRTRFADWPANASMVVEGTFTPTGGTATTFRAYFRAEIEIELTLDPPLEITDASQSVTVELNLADWFGRPDGTVLDLSQFDFGTTGTVIDFELEMENGLTVGDGSAD